MGYNGDTDFYACYNGGSGCSVSAQCCYKWGSCP